MKPYFSWIFGGIAFVLLVPVSIVLFQGFIVDSMTPDHRILPLTWVMLIFAMLFWVSSLYFGLKRYPHRRISVIYVFSTAFLCSIFLGILIYANYPYVENHILASIGMFEWLEPVCDGGLTCDTLMDLAHG